MLNDRGTYNDLCNAHFLMQKSTDFYFNQSVYLQSRLKHHLTVLSLTQYNLIHYSTTPSGKTALHLAAWKGPLSHVTALLDRGVLIDTHSNSPGNTWFHEIETCGVM